MAKQKKMSQNAFISMHLERIALQEDVFHEERNQMKEQLITHTNILATCTKKNEVLLEKVMKIEALLIELMAEEG